MKPLIEELETVLSMADRFFRETALPELKIRRAGICVDEVFSNIVKYSGAASVPVAERIQGGADLFITKNHTDDASYARIDGKNLLTLTMNLSDKEEMRNEI